MRASIPHVLYNIDRALRDFRRDAVVPMRHCLALVVTWLVAMADPGQVEPTRGLGAELGGMDATGATAGGRRR